MNFHPKPSLRQLIGMSVFALCVLLIGIFGYRVYSSVCYTETKRVDRNVSGLDFEVLYTNCDAFAKSEWMSVFVMKAGDRNKTEIFNFDPIYYVDPPEIKVDLEHKRISISVAATGEIFLQKTQWHDMTVDYHIGKIILPDVAAGAPSSQKK
jgi:hypothetical protein